MSMSEKNRNTIHRNRLAMIQQFQDIEDQIAYLRRSMNPAGDDYMDEFETYMNHQASNMMTRVMELGSLLASNRALIVGSKK
jgi:vacuolar-type H+-ATPase subunit D/Vma8